MRPAIGRNRHRTGHRTATKAGHSVHVGIDINEVICRHTVHHALYDVTAAGPTGFRTDPGFHSPFIQSEATLIRQLQMRFSRGQIQAAKDQRIRRIRKVCPHQNFLRIDEPIIIRIPQGRMTVVHILLVAIGDAIFIRVILVIVSSIEI